MRKTNGGLMERIKDFRGLILVGIGIVAFLIGMNCGIAPLTVVGVVLFFIGMTMLEQEKAARYAAASPEERAEMDRQEEERRKEEAERQRVYEEEQIRQQAREDWHNTHYF